MNNIFIFILFHLCNVNNNFNFYEISVKYVMFFMINSKFDSNF